MTDFTFDEFVINSKRMIPTFALLSRQLKKHCLVFISIKIECWIKSMFILGIISSVCKNNLLKTASPDFYDMFYKRGFPVAWKKSMLCPYIRKKANYGNIIKLVWLHWVGSLINSSHVIGQTFSDVFRGYRNSSAAWDGLINFYQV